jgi:NADH-quinone oxidoreductase subunit A
MASANLDVLMPIVIMMILTVGLFAGGMIVTHLLSPKKPTKLKEMPYECGEEPVGDAWSAFNIRFYVVGLIFIVFDVESTLMFPVVSVFKQFNEQGNGIYALIVLLSFISVLLEGLAYCWKKGDLDWVKSFQKSLNNNLDKK